LEDTVLSELVSAAATTAAEAKARRPQKTNAGQELLAAILKSLDEEKAEDIVSIELAGKSEMADFMVVASGRSSRQVSALSEKLTDRVKASFGVISRVEGKSQGDWVLIDSGDVIIHIFRPEVREFYQLEKMWMAAPGQPH
jgi:ribosome-associated protein